MQEQIGLKFLMNLNFFAVSVTKDKAREIIRLFRNRSDAIVHDETESWAVKLSEVNCIHVVDLKQQEQNPPGVPGGTPISGARY